MPSGRCGLISPMTRSRMPIIGWPGLLAEAGLLGRFLDLERDLRVAAQDRRDLPQHVGAVDAEGQADVGLDAAMAGHHVDLEAAP